MMDVCNLVTQGRVQLEFMQRGDIRATILGRLATTSEL